MARRTFGWVQNPGKLSNLKKVVSVFKLNSKYNIWLREVRLPLLKKYNLPTTESCKLSDIVKYSQVDKKSIDSSINLILIKEIGKSFIYPIKKNKLLGFLETKE